MYLFANLSGRTSGMMNLIKTREERSKEIKLKERPLMQDDQKQVYQTIPSFQKFQIQ